MSESANPTVVLDVLIAAIVAYGRATDPEPPAIRRLAAAADNTAEAVTAIPILIMGRPSWPLLFFCRTSIPISSSFTYRPTPGLIDTTYVFPATAIPNHYGE